MSSEPCSCGFDCVGYGAWVCEFPGAVDGDGGADAGVGDPCVGAVVFWTVGKFVHGLDDNGGGSWESWWESLVMIEGDETRTRVAEVLRAAMKRAYVSVGVARCYLPVVVSLLWGRSFEILSCISDNISLILSFSCPF